MKYYKVEYGWTVWSEDCRFFTGSKFFNTREDAETFMADSMHCKFKLVTLKEISDLDAEVINEEYFGMTPEDILLDF